jgi:UTP--glucose-1-phosphate uridylyltransferase
MAYEKQLAELVDKMESEKVSEVAIRSFVHYYRKLVAGQTGALPESEITPLETLPDAELLDDGIEDRGLEEMKKSVHIVLNGGLGTSMGLSGPKSLLPVRDGLTFLDIIIRRCLSAGIPLVLMNSFATRKASLERVGRYVSRDDRAVIDFVQHKIPKVDRHTLGPVRLDADPSLEWCPPGHGDLYPALWASGALDELLERGHRYAFVSNADNLGGYVDPAILGYMVENGMTFLMEACDRTRVDRKGGHLARKRDGTLSLREAAQCPESDLSSFQDVTLHRYFNTNNIWVDLESLAELMNERNGVLGLPMIRNEKTVDPRDPGSTPVYQLETAMGSAIEVFDSPSAIRVSRDRFAPVKTTSDLLRVRSDASELTEDLRLVPNPAREEAPPIIDLDYRYYGRIDDFERRFPKGPPSLLRCQSLRVIGDFYFGGNIRIEGEVELVNDEESQKRLDDGAVLRDVGLRS